MLDLFFKDILPISTFQKETMIIGYSITLNFHVDVGLVVTNLHLSKQPKTTSVLYYFLVHRYLSFLYGSYEHKIWG